jgi:hypothetical protein
VLPGVSSRERVLGRTTRENTYWSHVVVFGRRSACDRSRSTRQHPRQQVPRYPWQLACPRNSTRGSTLAAMVLFAHRLCQRVHTGRTPAICAGGLPCDWYRNGAWGAVLLVAHWPTPCDCSLRRDVTGRTLAAPCDCSLRHRATGRTLAVPCDGSLQAHPITSRRESFPCD